VVGRRVIHQLSRFGAARAPPPPPMDISRSPDAGLIAGHIISAAAAAAADEPRRRRSKRRSTDEKRAAAAASLSRCDDASPAFPADDGWRRGVVVSGVRQRTKLTHVGPGYNWDG